MRNCVTSRPRRHPSASRTATSVPRAAKRYLGLLVLPETELSQSEYQLMPNFHRIKVVSRFRLLNSELILEGI